MDAQRSALEFQSWGRTMMLPPPLPSAHGHAYNAGKMSTAFCGIVLRDTKFRISLNFKAVQF